MAARPALFRFQAIYKELLILVHFLAIQTSIFAALYGLVKR